MATADNPKPETLKSGNPNPDMAESDIRNPTGIFTKEQIEDIAKKLDEIGSGIKDYQPLADEIRKAFEQPFSDMINIFQKIENAISSIYGIEPQNSLSSITDKSALSASGENAEGDHRQVLADGTVASTTEDGHIVPATPPITSATAEDELSDLSDTAQEQLDHSEEVEDNEKSRHKKILKSLHAIAIHDIGIYGKITDALTNFGKSFVKSQINKRLGDKVVGGKKLSEYKLFQMMFGEERDMAEETADNTKAIAEHAANILKEIQGIAGDKQSENLLKISEQLSENGMDAHVWFAHIVAAENDILKTIQDNAIDTSDWHSRFLTSQTGVIDAIKEKDLTVNIPPVTETPSEIETAAAVKEIDKTTKDILSLYKTESSQKADPQRDITATDDKAIQEQTKILSEQAEILTEAMFEQTEVLTDQTKVLSDQTEILTEAVFEQTEVISEIRDAAIDVVSHGIKSEKAAGKRHQEILKKFSGAATSGSGSDSPVKQRGRKGDKDKQIDKLGKDIKKGAGKGGKPGPGGGGLGGLFGGGGMMGMAVIGVILAAVVGLVIGKLLDGLMTKFLGQSLGGAAFDKLNPNDTTEAHQKKIKEETRTSAELKDKDIRKQEKEKLIDRINAKQARLADISASDSTKSPDFLTPQEWKELEADKASLEQLRRLDQKDKQGKLTQATPQEEKVARTRQTDAAVETAIPLKEKKAKGEKLTEPEQQKLADSEKTIKEVRATKQKTKLEPANRSGEKLSKITEDMTLGDMLSVHESKGNYNIYNQGAGHKYKQGQTDFSQMTVDEVLEKQNLKKTDKDKLFAVGKYQIIPDTMKAAKKEMGLKGDEKFTPEMQDRIFSEYLSTKKRPQIEKFIKSGEGLDKAALASGQEWASVGVDSKRGGSYYAGDGVNKAAVSPAQMKTALKVARDRYSQALSDGKSEKEAYKIATTGLGAASGGEKPENTEVIAKSDAAAITESPKVAPVVEAQQPSETVAAKEEIKRASEPDDTFNSIGSDFEASPIISAQVSESSSRRSSSASKSATLTASGKDSTRPIAPAPTIVPAQVENKPSPPVQRIAERPADIAKANAQAKAAGPRVDNSRMENLMKEQNQILAQMQQQKKTENPAGDTDQKIPLGFDDPHLQAYAADLHG